MDAAASSRLAAEKQAYMSLPRPGVSSRTSSTTTPSELLCGVCDICGIYDSYSSIYSQNSKVDNGTFQETETAIITDCSGSENSDKVNCAVKKNLFVKAIVNTLETDIENISLSILKKDSSEESGFSSLANYNDILQSPNNFINRVFDQNFKNSIIMSQSANNISTNFRLVSSDLVSNNASEYLRANYEDLRKEVIYSTLNKSTTAVKNGKKDNVKLSAFVKYNKNAILAKSTIPQNSFEKESSLTLLKFNNERVKMRSDFQSSPVLPARCKLNVSSISGSRSARIFENRVSLVLENLQTEAEYLQKLINAAQKSVPLPY